MANIRPILVEHIEATISIPKAFPNIPNKVYLKPNFKELVIVRTIPGPGIAIIIAADKQ
jgi:hypothetical protein